MLGARQTGKTTLIQRIENELFISFVRPDVRQRYEKHPGLLAGKVEALKVRNKKRRKLVILDEVQKVPAILDTVQDLIDRKQANFILTGSSARKLRKGGRVNLLPGRVVALKLDPLGMTEFPPESLTELLMYGSLPGVLAVKKAADRQTDLESYVTTYLEEEIRAEAVVRHVGNFSRFLEYAAAESGNIVNFRKLSQEIGVAHTTIASYYGILEDCFIAERVEPVTKSRIRKKLTKSHRYLFFDLGVRRIAAQEGARLPREILGRLFEQFVGLELLRLSRLRENGFHIRFWRDHAGPEVDWVLERQGQYTPVEVKWTDAPKVSDIKYLKLFMSEYSSKRGYLVCQTPKKNKIR